MNDIKFKIDEGTDKIVRVVDDKGKISFEIYLDADNRIYISTKEGTISIWPHSNNAITLVNYVDK